MKAWGVPTVTCIDKLPVQEIPPLSYHTREDGRTGDYAQTSARNHPATCVIGTSVSDTCDGSLA